MRNSLPWCEIETVFLDMDGTLLDLHFDNHFWREHVPARFAEKNQLSIAQAKATLMPRFESLQGTIDWYCVDFWSRELDLDVPALKLELVHLIQVHPHVPEFLSALRCANKRVTLLTNAHQKVVDIKMDKTQLQGYFDDIISAHQFRLPKEHPQFWRTLARIDSFTKNATLFIDDSTVVLQAAKDYGIAHLRGITRPDSKMGEKSMAGFVGMPSFEHLIREIEQQVLL